MPNATQQVEAPEPAVLNVVFGALSDPTRRAIVDQLTHGEATMSQIAAGFDMSLPGVSKHVTVLEEAGIVSRWRTGRVRRCRLNVDQLQMANEWIAERTAFWTDTLENLANFVEQQADQP